MDDNGKALATIDDGAMLALVSDGDCSKLTDAQRLQYYQARCDAAGLDRRAVPFQFIRLNGKMVLYALKAATDQLAAKHGIMLQIIDQRTEADVRTVTVRAKARDGRETDEIGCVLVRGLAGDALCNAFMKAVTKAKRRAVLSICGLGMTDETELETIPGVEPAALPAASAGVKADPPAADRADFWWAPTCWGDRKRLIEPAEAAALASRCAALGIEATDLAAVIAGPNKPPIPSVAAITRRQLDALHDRLSKVESGSLAWLRQTDGRYAFADIQPTEAAQDVPY